MNVIRKILAMISALLGIFFLLLTFKAISMTLSDSHPSTAFEQVVEWSLVAALLGFSCVLMRFADHNLRYQKESRVPFWREMWRRPTKKVLVTLIVTWGVVGLIYSVLFWYVHR